MGQNTSDSFEKRDNELPKEFDPSCRLLNVKALSSKRAHREDAVLNKDKKDKVNDCAEEGKFPEERDDKKSNEKNEVYNTNRPSSQTYPNDLQKNVHKNSLEEKKGNQNRDSNIYRKEMEYGNDSETEDMHESNETLKDQVNHMDLEWEHDERFGFDVLSWSSWTYIDSEFSTDDDVDENSQGLQNNDEKGSQKYKVSERLSHDNDIPLITYEFDEYQGEKEMRINLDGKILTTLEADIQLCDVSEEKKRDTDEQSNNINNIVESSKRNEARYRVADNDEKPIKVSDEGPKNKEKEARDRDKDEEKEVRDRDKDKVKEPHDRDKDKEKEARDRDKDKEKEARDRDKDNKEQANETRRKTARSISKHPSMSLKDEKCCALADLLRQ